MILLGLQLLLSTQEKKYNEIAFTLQLAHTCEHLDINTQLKDTFKSDKIF